MKARDFDEKFDRGEDITSELGVTRQSIIKVWIAEMLEHKAS